MGHCDCCWVCNLYLLGALVDFATKMGRETLSTHSRIMERETTHHGRFVYGRDVPGGREYPAGPGEGYRGGVVGFGSDSMNSERLKMKKRS